MQQYSYGMTFDDRLGAALGDHADTTEREAKRLAFYIFWNVKHEFSRRAAVKNNRAIARSAQSGQCNRLCCK